MPVSLSRAQRYRVDQGLDLAAPGPGWPRPLVTSPTGAGLPHPYVVPVIAGLAWWAFLDGERLLECANHWHCQVCGLACEDTASVLLSGTRVLNDAPLHERCCRLAAIRCPHLVATDIYTPAAVTRADILADGHPLSDRPAAWRQQWRVSAHRSQLPADL